MYDTAPTASRTNPLLTLNNFSKQDRAGAHETAQQFEASFLRNMLEPMFTDLGEGGTWGGGTGSDAWRGMLIDEYANSIAKAGGVGIAGAVERELLAIQENSL